MTQMMMKASVALVTLFLLLSSVTVLASQNSYQPSVCCFKFIARKLNPKMVMNFQHTNFQCAKKGVLFTMEKDQVICADPSMEWVKKLIKDLQKGASPL